MQNTPQPDQTHDAIVALLRDHPPRPAHDPSELNIAPGRVESEVTTAPSIEQVAAPAVDVTPAAAAPAPAVPPLPKTLAVEPMAPAKPVEPARRATPSSDIRMDAELHRPPAKRGRGLLRFVSLVIVGIGATIAWQVYGEVAKEKVTDLLAAVPVASAEQANAAEPQPAETVQTAAAETPPQPAAPAAAAPAQADAAAPAAPAAPPADTAQAQAAIPPDVTEKMDAMSREIASLKQTVEQLKAGQLQMNRDLAKTMEHQVKQKTPPAKQTSAQPSQSTAPRAAATPQPSAAAPVQRAAASPPNHGQPQMYGQSRVYDRPPQSYGRSNDEAYARPYGGRGYDSADADRDAVYVAPPPSPNYQPGYTTIPRPPAPMQ